MNVKTDFNNLARQLLPLHKRQPEREGLLQALLLPLRRLSGLFDTWRDDMRRQINMTGQVGILEGYLRHKYHAPSLQIETCTEEGLTFGLEVEGAANAQPIGKNTFDTDPATREPCPVAIPLRGEDQKGFGDADFVVYVPPGIDLEGVRIDVERFKQVLVTYKIIQQ